MEDDGIRVNWRAAIVPGGSERPIYGYLSRIGKRTAVVRVDHNLPAGHRCNLALMLPKSRPDEESRFIEGSGVVAISVLRSMQFHLTIDPLELAGDGAALLEEHIWLHGQTWKKPK